MKAVPLAALGLAACAAPASPAAREAGPAFDPVAFFTGASHGKATLKQIFKRDRRVSVDSLGRATPGGGVLLRQAIRTEGSAPRTRLWSLRPAGAGHWSGTLTDATGPVAVDAVGAAIRIRYSMKGGLAVEQWLVPLSATSLDNRLSVRKFGLTVASLHERIDKS